MRILFFGDSITQGFWSEEGGWVEVIRKYYDGLAIADLRTNKQPVVFNLGVSGDTTKNLLARIEQETKVRIWPDDPITVVISIGTNDDLFESDKQWVTPEEFEENLEKIIDAVIPLAKNVVLVGNVAVDESRTTPVFWGDFHYTNKELERSELVIKKVGEQRHLPYVPIFQPFLAELHKGNDLLADGLHPNTAGHKFIADRVLAELKKVI